MNLSAAAKKSLELTGSYKCKAPGSAYRVVITERFALLSYNKLYIKGFLAGLNEGDCYRHETGKVTSRRCSWVEATSAHGFDRQGIKGLLYFVSDGGNRVGFVVDHTYTGLDALTEKDLDVMSDGMYGSEKQFACQDEDGHDGEDCTCHRRPVWNEESRTYELQ